MLGARIGRFALVLVSGLLLQSAALRGGTDPAAAAPLDFSRDIKPILSENCFKCHGPDEKERKGKLRLDTRDGGLAERKGGAAVVPNNTAKSLLIERITADDPELRMPPKKTGKQLKPGQIALLKKWIDQGAKWSDHWAFVAPQRPPVPTPRQPSPGAGRGLGGSWVCNPIDNFILSRLHIEGLQTSAETSKTSLIRRVTLDLTGLPPTLAEIDAFLADTRDGAYERLVDRLLASPRYGERMALDWLDAARFADTHGYHIDSGRDMTRWREWVIDAFNQNKRFDQFTVEQLAGDLLPNATLDQRIASGFNRNHMINFEGGAVPEEYHTAYIVDRVNTTGTVWLGLGVGCAQCHDHKYDPITQKEYYQLFAFFHNVPESGLDGSKGNAAPLLKTPTPAQQKQRDELTARMRELDRQLAGPLPELDAAQGQWEKTLLDRGPIDWKQVELVSMKAIGGAVLSQSTSNAILVEGPNPATETYTVVAKTGLEKLTGIRVEALPFAKLVNRGPGRSVNGNCVLTDVRVLANGKPAKLVKATASFSQDGFPVAQAIDDRPSSGWAIHPRVGEAHEAVFSFAAPLPLEQGTELTIVLDFQSPHTQHQFGKFRVMATDAVEPHRGDEVPGKLREVAAVSAEKRSPEQRAELQAFYRANVSPSLKAIREEIAKLRQEDTNLEKQIPTAMVMQEMPKPRDTFLLVRGQYDKKGEKVGADVPAFLPPLAKPRGANTPGSPDRLDLARWLVRPEHPLMARVIVNRYWQLYFGTGLVKTAEDFGSQGEWPSHPELLDWLATEFIQSDWNVKHMQRLIVTSSTYRQSAAVTPALLAKDPENRLLARQSRLRLQAEFIRDQALAVSGLMDGEIGGRSVSPYQPPGLWEELMSRADGANWTAQTYKQSTGKDLYRRTMYTFWKRTCPPPTLATFDAPDRETCTVRRARTNTPLQALILMNDPTYVEASRKLAERIMLEGGATPESRITFAFRLTTTRPPTEKETELLRRVFDEQLAKYRKDAAAAEKLLRVGEAKRHDQLDAAELAAWSIVASVLLNLDEVVTRG